MLANNQEQVQRRAKALTRALAQPPAHPLDPLSIGELQRAADACRSRAQELGLAEVLRFSTVGLQVGCSAPCWDEERVAGKENGETAKGGPAHTVTSRTRGPDGSQRAGEQR